MTETGRVLQKTVVLAYTDVCAMGSRALLSVNGAVDGSFFESIDLSQPRPACVNPFASVDSQINCLPVIQCLNAKVSCIVVNVQLDGRVCHYIVSKILDLLNERYVIHLLVVASKSESNPVLLHTGVANLIVLSALRLENYDDALYENCLFAAQPLTCNKSLPDTTPIVDPFLSTLIQMIHIEQIPTNLLLVPGHKISEGTRVSDQSTRQSIDLIQQVLSKRLQVDFNTDVVSSLVYKGKNDSDGDLASMIYM